MGADFNILEYADPELDNITGGEKTNILDLDLEQVEVETKEDKLKKEAKEVKAKGGDIQTTQQPENRGTGTPGVRQQTESTNVTALPPGAQSVTQSAPPQPGNAISQAHPQAALVHLQQSANMGRPLPIGQRLLASDGTIGVVTSTNTITVSYPSTFPGHPQRISQAQLQGWPLRDCQASNIVEHY